MADGYTNIAGINFNTDCINFDKDKTFVNNGFAQVTLKDGTVFTYNEESQKYWHNNIYNQNSKNKLPATVEYAQVNNHGNKSIMQNYITTNGCNFTSVKSANQSTYFDLYGTNIRKMDTKNGIGDTIEINDGSSVKRLWSDNNDKLIDRNAYENNYNH